MSLTTEELLNLGLRDPRDLKDFDPTILSMYEEFMASLRATSEEAIVVDAWGDFDPAIFDLHDRLQVARQQVIFSILPTLIESLEAIIKELGDNDDDDETQQLRLLQQLVSEFLNTENSRSIRRSSPAVPQKLGSIDTLIEGGRIVWPGRYEVWGSNSEYAVVTAICDVDRYPWDLLPRLLGFARRTNLVRSAGRVITDTFGRLDSLPNELSGEGFSEFDTAFLGACTGSEDDIVFGDVLLGRDEALARVAFERYGRGPFALIEWLRNDH